MAISREALKAKAQGFTISIRTMDDKQRTQTPSEAYGKDYNNLRGLVLQVHSDLADILPPPVTFFQGNSSLFTRQSYGEISTFCEQIYQILSTYDA